MIYSVWNIDVYKTETKFNTGKMDDENDNFSVL